MNPSCAHLPMRPPKRPPKKNARKRLIIQEKVYRELEAAKTRAQDAQAEFRRCATLAASLQAQLVEAAHSLTDMLQRNMTDSSPQTTVADMVDKLCQVQLLHGAVRHSADLLQQACDHVLQSERLVHALEAQAAAKPAPSESVHQQMHQPPPPPAPPILGSKYGSLDAGAFFSAAAAAPLPSPQPIETPSTAPHDPKSPSSAPHNLPALHSPGHHSPCSTPTDSDSTRVSQPLQPTLSDAHRAAAAAAASAAPRPPGSGGTDDGSSVQRYLSRSSSAQPQWPIATSLSPWTVPSLEPAPSAPANVWQMTPADKRRAERALPRARTSGPGSFAPPTAPERPPASHLPGSPGGPGTNELYERSLSAPLRYPNPHGMHAFPPTDSSFGMERVLSASDAYASGPVTPTQPAVHPGTGANAWLQPGSSSEDESEDPKQNAASLMLSMLAPGVPQDLLWSLSALDRTESQDVLSRAASAHMPQFAAAHASAIPGSPGRGPGMLSGRSRSDAEALLAGMHASGGTPQRMAQYQSGRGGGGRGRAFAAQMSQLFPHEISEAHATLPPPRMPSEDAVEETRSQVKAVAAALQATYSSLQRCALPLVQQLAADARAAAPVLVGAASLPEASWSQTPGRAFDSQRSLSGLSSVQPMYPSSGGQRWPAAAYQGHSHAPPPPPRAPSGHSPHSWGPAEMLPPKQSPLQMTHGGTRAWAPLPSEFAQSEVLLGPPPSRTVSAGVGYPLEHMHSGSGHGGMFDQLGRMPSAGFPSEPLMHAPSMPGYGSGRDSLPRAPSANYAAADALLRASSSGTPPLEQLQRVLSSSGYGGDVPSGSTDRLPRLRSTPPGADQMVLHALFARELAGQPHATHLLYPRCELCSVHSNSGPSLTAHLESKGHHHKVMGEAALLCEAVSTRPAESPQAAQSSSGGSRVSAAAAASSKEEGGSSTLMHYRPRLHGVRIADEAVSKDVLALLFQLVQWQMRKADKFREGLPRTMKRCLAGMKEVAWAVSEPGRAKLVLIAPNIQIPCPDSILLEQVLELVAKCRKAGVPVIMGPSRKQLGMAFRTSEGSKSTFKLMSAVALLDTSGAETKWNDIVARHATLPKAEEVPLTAEEAPAEGAAEEPPQAVSRAVHVPVVGGSPGAAAALGSSSQVLAERIRARVRESPDFRATFQNLLEQASVLLGQVAAVASQGPRSRGLGR
eukprot:jgi/Ulvmu1/7860/UM004_0091.1